MDGREAYSYGDTDFRVNPQLYRIGRGEQGVLTAEPYKSEILPYWRFKTPTEARRSSEKIYGLYLGYREAGDFVGMDMARKYLQMGYTRARRYANHKSGKKYGAGEALPQEADWATNEKAQSARIFAGWLEAVKKDPAYARMRLAHSLSEDLA